MAAKGDMQSTSSVGEAATSDDATRFTDLGFLRARSLFVVLLAVTGVGLAWFMPEAGAMTSASGWMTGWVDWGLSFLSNLASSAGSKSLQLRPIQDRILRQKPDLWTRSLPL